MRVLWLTNLPMPNLAVALGQKPFPSQGWMPALADALKENSNLDLAVATAVQGEGFHKKSLRGVDYYVLSMPKGGVNSKHIQQSLINEYQCVLDEFKPDVIHIHGTEYYQGLLTGRGHLKCPTVISIQGIIDVCRNHYLGGIPTGALIRTRTLRDWITFDGLIEQKVRWDKRAKWEREIFSRNQAFIGRTVWDRAHTRRLNPHAKC